MNKGYFEKLNIALKEQDRAVPRLILDLDILDANIEVFKSQCKENASFRLVAKSLPSEPLIRYILEKMDSNKLMVFHQPFLSCLTKYQGPKSDILLGKPMPLKTAQYYYHNLAKNESGFDPFQQIQWLIDTEKRLEEYIALAKDLGRPLKLNFEIDIGLHRGGFRHLEELRSALLLLSQHPEAGQFSGLMGYDPHLVKVPKIIRSLKKGLQTSNQFYYDCKELIQQEFPQFCEEGLTFNGAGSPTFKLHASQDSPLNDISAGSCFVKPTTFDIPSLSDYEPACFIATPVLKKMSGTTIPGLERIKGLLPFFKRHYAQSYFIYGGYWKADYVYPLGVKQNNLFGASTNQTMVNAPAGEQLDVDDFVFLRPQQSEFVFLQFGKLLVTRSGEVLDEWGILEH